MVTYEGIFTFVMLIVAVVSLCADLWCDDNRPKKRRK